MGDEILGHFAVVAAQISITRKAASRAAQPGHYNHIDDHKISNGEHSVGHQMPKRLAVLAVIPHQADGDEKQPKRHVLLANDKQHHKQGSQPKPPFLEEKEQPRQHHGGQHIGVVVIAQGLDDAEGEEEHSRGQDGHPIVFGIEPNQFVETPTAQEHCRDLHDEQGVTAEKVD